MGHPCRMSSRGWVSFFRSLTKSQSFPHRPLSTGQIIHQRQADLKTRRNAGANLGKAPPLENTRLTEVITIYEKLTKSRAAETTTGLEQQEEGEVGVGAAEPSSSSDVFRPSSNHLDYLGRGPHGPKFTSPLAKPGQFSSPNLDDPGGSAPAGAAAESARVLDFSKFRHILTKNYSYFSAKTGLIQSHTLDTLTWDQGQAPPSSAEGGDAPTPPPSLTSTDLILKSTQFCLSIVNPTEKDLAFLGTQLHVHDLTLRDIREQNTEEKVEVFKHYTFLSLRPYLDVSGGGSAQAGPSASPNIDLNVLLFPSGFALLIHHGHHWTGFRDMLGFLHLLCSYGSSALTPDWVLFSIFIELGQDAKYSVKTLEPRILNLRVSDLDLDPNSASALEAKEALASELSHVLRRNFENEFEIYKINRFIQPKIKVLRMLGPKCGSRLSPGVLSLLSGTRKEFEEVGDALGNFSHILERSQDTCLTLANVRQSQESNAMGKSMKRISEWALLFLPLQALAGFLGMNVRVPWQEVEGTGPFWGIILSSGVLLGVLWRLRNETAGFFARRGRSKGGSTKGKK